MYVIEARAGPSAGDGPDEAGKIRSVLLAMALALPLVRVVLAVLRSRIAHMILIAYLTARSSVNFTQIRGR